MSLTESEVLNALRVVQDPDLHRDIVSLGFVKDVRIDGSDVSFVIELTTPACPVREQLEQQARHAVASLPGVKEVNITMTARVRERGAQAEDLLPGVRQCIAIASGKGGVGKSTVSVNLAIALAQTGARVGLMDADIYGPSIPLMMGAQNDRPYVEEQKLVPIERFGVKMMSLGFLIEDDQTVLWRGPMVATTVRQLVADVRWGELDYLLVDLPPGTGDAPMTLAQIVPLTGVVIVTTPHSVAASIAGKSAALFRRLNSPVLGVVENMGTYICPNCQTESRLFMGDSGDRLAENLKVPFMGSIPLDPMISQASNEGIPSVIQHPNRPQAQAFRDVAGRLAQEVSVISLGSEATDMSFLGQ